MPFCNCGIKQVVLCENIAEEKAFEWSQQGFIQRLKLQPPWRTYKHYYRKVPLSSFHLNNHSDTIGFRPQQTQKLELHTKYIALCESTAEEVSFEWSHQRISSTDSKVRTTY